MPSPISDHKKKTYQVSRRHPSSLLDQTGRVLVDFGGGGGDLVDGELLPGSRALDVVQGLLQALQLNLDLGLCLLGVLDGDLLEALDGLDLLAHVVGFGLERLEVLLDLVDDGRVREHAAVVAEVDRRGLLRQDLHPASGVVVSLLEVGQGRRRAASEAELGADLAPVELGNCAGLR